MHTHKGKGEGGGEEGGKSRPVITLRTCWILLHVASNGCPSTNPKKLIYANSIGGPITKWSAVVFSIIERNEAAGIFHRS